MSSQTIAQLILSIYFGIALLIFITLCWMENHQDTKNVQTGVTFEIPPSPQYRVTLFLAIAVLWPMWVNKITVKKFEVKLFRKKTPHK